MYAKLLFSIPLSFRRALIWPLAPTKVTPYTLVITVCFTSRRSTWCAPDQGQIRVSEGQIRVDNERQVQPDQGQYRGSLKNEVRLVEKTRDFGCCVVAKVG